MSERICQAAQLLDHSESPHFTHNPCESELEFFIRIIHSFENFTARHSGQRDSISWRRPFTPCEFPCGFSSRFSGIPPSDGPHCVRVPEVSGFLQKTLFCAVEPPARTSGGARGRRSTRAYSIITSSSGESNQALIRSNVSGSIRTADHETVASSARTSIFCVSMRPPALSMISNCSISARVEDWGEQRKYWLLVCRLSRES